MAPEPRWLGSEGASEPESPQEPGSPAVQDASPQDAQADEHSPAPAQAPDRAKRAKRARSFWRDLVIIVFAALVLTILLKTFVMSFMPVFMLVICRSVEMESGVKPCFTAGIAWRQEKLPPPWPTSKITPRLRASNR